MITSAGLTYINTKSNLSDISDLISTKSKLFEKNIYQKNLFEKNMKIYQTWRFNTFMTLEIIARNVNWMTPS